jgi:hypothetical protein
MGARGALLAFAVLMAAMGLLCVVWSFKVPTDRGPLTLALIGAAFLVGSAAVSRMALRAGRHDGF